jgi:hypothetical protein
VRLGQAVTMRRARGSGGRDGGHGGSYYIRGKQRDVFGRAVASVASDLDNHNNEGEPRNGSRASVGRWQKRCRRVRWRGSTVDS